MDFRKIVVLERLGHQHYWMIHGFLLIAFCTAFASLMVESQDFFSLVQDASVVDGDLLSWTRKLKELLENSLGWEFQQKSAVDGIYFEENDEYAPVVEMLDEPSGSEPTSS